MPSGYSENGVHLGKNRGRKAWRAVGWMGAAEMAAKEKKEQFYVGPATEEVDDST